jgi:hypothetical protein
MLFSQRTDHAPTRCESERELRNNTVAAPTWASVYQMHLNRQSFVSFIPASNFKGHLRLLLLSPPPRANRLNTRPFVRLLRITGGNEKLGGYALWIFDAGQKL